MGRATAPAHEIAEQVVEHIGKGGRKVTIAAATGALTAAAFECGMAVTVIGGLFIRVFQDLMRLVGLFEFGLGCRVVDIAVGVQFLGLLTIALFDLLGACALGNPENVVIVAFCHGSSTLKGNAKTGPFPGAGRCVWSVP